MLVLPLFHFAFLIAAMSIEPSTIDAPSAYSDQAFTDYASELPVAQLRIPPHSMEAESSVLGGLLLDNSAWDRIGDAVQEDDFYRYEHRMIFGVCAKLINATKPADVITVFEALQSLGKADEVGGINYLNNLAQYVPSAANIRRYAEIVRERAILRKLLTASDEIATQAFNPKGKPVDEILDEAEQKIFKIGEEGNKNKQGFQSMDKLVVELLDRVQEMSENPNDITGVPTGFYDLDRMTSGFQAGDMVVLAARVAAPGCCRCGVPAEMGGRAVTAGSGPSRGSTVGRAAMAVDVSNVREWLIDGGRSSPVPGDMIDSLCKRLVASGIPLFRVAFYIRTLHPDIFGRNFIWRPDEPKNCRRV